MWHLVLQSHHNWKCFAKKLLGPDAMLEWMRVPNSNNWKSLRWLMSLYGRIWWRVNITFMRKRYVIHLAGRDRFYNMSLVSMSDDDTQHKHTHTHIPHIQGDLACRSYQLHNCWRCNWRLERDEYIVPTTRPRDGGAFLHKCEYVKITFSMNQCFLRTLN